jgi:hypothetical protein
MSLDGKEIRYNEPWIRVALAHFAQRCNPKLMRWRIHARKSLMWVKLLTDGLMHCQVGTQSPGKSEMFVLLDK